jgi:hypothetical protein
MGGSTYFFFYIIFLSIGLVAGLFSLRTTHSKRFITSLALALCVLPAVYYYYIIDLFSSSVPFTDDYEILKGVAAMLEASDARTFSEALFKQVNEHRFAYERGLIWLYRILVGDFSIKAQILLGNSLLIGIAVLLYKSFKTTGLSLFYFLPVPLLLFNLSFYENSIWAIAALQNTSLLFFALLMAYFLSKQQQHYRYAALAVCVVASFTSGSGIALWGIGLVILLAQKYYRLAGIWVIAMLSVLLFYFTFDYQVAPKEIGALWRHPFLNLIQLLAFWGNIFVGDFTHTAAHGRVYTDMALAVACGGVIGLVFMAVVLRIAKGLWEDTKQDSSLWFSFGAMAFGLGTGAMLVLSRPIPFNILYEGDVFSRRYMIFGAVLLACTYVALLSLLRQFQWANKAGFAVLGIALFIHLDSYIAHLPALKVWKEELELDRLYWLDHKMLLSFGENYQDKLYWNHPTKMIDVLDDLEEKKLFQVGRNPLAVSGNSLLDSDILETAEDISLQIESKAQRGWLNRWNEEITITGEVAAGAERHTIGYILLKSDDHVFILPAIPATNTREDFLRDRRFFGRDFSYSFLRTKFPPARYELWLLKKGEGDIWILLGTDSLLTLSNES